MANYYANSGEFQVNTYTANEQYWSSVTALSNGGFAVAWMSLGQDGSGYSIYGQRYNANGYRAGGEFQINTCTTNWQCCPSMTALSDGGLIVTWESEEQDGSDDGVYGQRYNVSGNRVGSEFLVNTYTTGYQEYSSVTALSSGGFVVTWESEEQDGSGDGVYGQRYNVGGNRVGSEFLVNTYTTNDQKDPSVTALNNGGFVVTWESIGQDGSGSGIYGQRYNASGGRAGSEFRVNTRTTNDQKDPSVTALNNGGFVIVWAADNSTVYGQLYNASGNAVGGEFHIYTNTQLHQDTPSVNALSDGGFIVTWPWIGNLEDGGTYGIYGQRYNASGNEVGSRFQVNTCTINFQEHPNMTALNDGGFVVTWDSWDGQDGSVCGVFGQRFRADGSPCRDFAGTSANETWTGGAGNDTINGRGGNDSLYGEAGNDTIYGEAGNDIINGGGGLDTMGGGSGDDTYYVNAAGDVIWEASGAGIDTVISRVTRTLGANQEKLILTGSAAINGTGNALGNTLTGNGAANTLDGMNGSDTLLGKQGSDILVGRFGNDILSGGSGNDFLFGRDGNDTLTGGGGSDIFVFDCSLNSASNNDNITDFSHVNDTVRLDRTIFTKFAVGTLLSTQFRASAAGTAADRNDFFLYNTSTGALLYDNDGSGAGVARQFATLENIPQNVTHNDFVVVA